MYGTERQGIIMTKQEFINELRSHLAGRVDDRELQTQISYYDSYITQEINSGKSIDEIMNQLGSPRLIAKTILQAYMAKNDPISRQYNNSNAGYEEPYEDDEPDKERESVQYKIWKIITLLLFLFAVIVVVGVIFKVVIYLIPVFIFIMALYLLIKILTS